MLQKVNVANESNVTVSRNMKTFLLALMQLQRAIAKMLKIYKKTNICSETSIDSRTNDTCRIYQKWVTKERCICERKF